MLRLEKARMTSGFRRRDAAPPGLSVKDARQRALALVGAQRAAQAGGGPEPRCTAQQLAARVLLALPGGPWWTLSDRFEQHLQAAMTTERIGVAHLRMPAVLGALAKLGISVSADDVESIALELDAWHRDKGVFVRAFVDGIVAAARVLGEQEGEADRLALSPTPSQRLEEWTRECEQESPSRADLATASDGTARSVSFPYYDSEGAPLRGELEQVMLANSPGRLGTQELQELASGAGGHEARERRATAKDWRMDDKLRARTERRNNPAVTKTWQTIQMPTGVWFHTEQLGHHDPVPPSRLSTPRIDLDGTGHLTNSELMVFRSLKKNMKADQPFSKMNSYQRLATPLPRHKPLSSALSTRSVPRHAHLVPELVMPHMDTGHRLHLDSGSQTERIMRATKPHYVPTRPLISRGSFQPHPSWAPTGTNR